MAVHNACGREMAGALREYRLWTARNRNRNRNHIGGRGGNGATKKTLATKASPALMAMATSGGRGGGGGGRKRACEAASKERVAELQRTPAGWRTLRWVMMKRQAELKNQVAEAAAMYTEEMEQRHKERCGGSGGEWVDLHLAGLARWGVDRGGMGAGRRGGGGEGESKYGLRYFSGCRFSVVLPGHAVYCILCLVIAYSTTRAHTYRGGCTKLFGIDESVPFSSSKGRSLSVGSPVLNGGHAELALRYALFVLGNGGRCILLIWAPLIIAHVNKIERRTRIFRNNIPQIERPIICQYATFQQIAELVHLHNDATVGTCRCLCSVHTHCFIAPPSQFLMNVATLSAVFTRVVHFNCLRGLRMANTLLARRLTGTWRRGKGATITTFTAFWRASSGR